MEDPDNGHTVVVRIDRVFCPWTGLTTDLRAIKIENITNVFRRKFVYILPTSIEIAEDIWKQVREELTAASCNEGLNKFRRSYRHTNPV
jgi:hypothetical protein